MAYEVLIQTGKGKNLARNGSIPLKTKVARMMIQTAKGLK